jgi:RHS repeat-associated protein
LGYWYNDLANTSLSHTATFGYDGVNRLTSAFATGNSTYNLSFSYTQDGSTGNYGNMTCVVNGSTNGLCPTYTFNPASNQITGYTYDASGNVTADGTHGYTWDAEGRATSVTGSGLTQTDTFNALGQVVEYSTNQPGGSYLSDQIFDPAGQWVGQFDVDGDYWWGQYVRLQGRVIANEAEAGTVFLHKDAEGTVHQSTAADSTLLQDQIFYPWGQSWELQGSWQGQEFADLDLFMTDDGFYRSLSRQYNPNVGRWLSPDPVGGHIEDPQTLNKYAYVRNNPTTLSDPTGLDFYLSCQQQSSTCGQVDGYTGLYQGTTTATTNANGNTTSTFTATIVTSDSLQDPSSGNTAVVNAHGVQITTAQGTAEGVFINGTPSATIQGDPNARGWSDFVFNISGSNTKTGNLDYGSATYKWSSSQGDIMSALGQMSGEFTYPGEGFLYNNHPGNFNFRFSPGADPSLFNYGPSPHFTVSEDPTRTVPVGPGYVSGFHVDSMTGSVGHLACAKLGWGCQ